MKVSKLIAELKKMPKDLEVYWADHDHNEFEVNDIARKVYLMDKSEGVKDWHKSALKMNEDFTPDKYVVIRP
jgi:hypothetical protein